MILLSIVYVYDSVIQLRNISWFQILDTNDKWIYVMFALKVCAQCYNFEVV